MKQYRVDRELVQDLLAGLDATLTRPGRLYLIGETSLVVEGLRPWTTQIEFHSEVAQADRGAFDRTAEQFAHDRGVELIDESPGDLVPLPEGHKRRMRPVREQAGLELDRLELLHFDPYSVAFRFIARGDEPDYHLVLQFLRHGWVEKAEMDARLEALLPDFSMQTIQQDPAEFRRKYKGLTQMWRAVRPNTTHRHTPA